MKHTGKQRTGKVQLEFDRRQKIELELESTSSQTMRGVTVPRHLGSGYNPYDTNVPSTGTATGRHRIEDMRRLSEWIRMKRDMSHGGGED